MSVIKPNVPAVSTAIVSPVQNIASQSNFPDNTTAEETINQIMLNEVLEDVQIFQLQLEDTLKLSTKTSKMKVRKISPFFIMPTTLKINLKFDMNIQIYY